MIRARRRCQSKPSTALTAARGPSPAKRVDVDDEAVFDREQHEGEHSMVAQGDDADAIADG